MIGVFIIPTGIGCKIGGHSGDATPYAKLIAAACDQLIVHPNVVNASDINEMSPNMLYVDGYMLDHLLMGNIYLREIRTNKILVVANDDNPDTENAVNAARTTLGINAEILLLNTPLEMIGGIDENGRAISQSDGVDQLLTQVLKHEFDALAIHTNISVDRDTVEYYYENGGINPWGHVEAVVSRMISNSICKPVAHAPRESTPLSPYAPRVVEPGIAPEFISQCHLHCVLKGLNKAPRYSESGLCNANIAFLMTPVGCVGIPHESCLQYKIPVIAVKENTCVLNDPMPDEFIIVENYKEAAGVVLAMREGLHFIER